MPTVLCREGGVMLFQFLYGVPSIRTLDRLSCIACSTLQQCGARMASCEVQSVAALRQTAPLRIQAENT